MVLMFLSLFNSVGRGCLAPWILKILAKSVVF